MTRILIVLLLACHSAAAASTSLSREIRCPPEPRRITLPPMCPSPEGIWHASIGKGLPILFLHGWTMDHRDEAWDYEPVLNHRIGWRRVYVDLPGMGRSAGTAVRDQDELLERLLAFTDREFGAAHFAIAGTSAGAYLAQALADRRSDRIAGMVLRMPMLVPDDRKRDRDPTGILITGKPVTSVMSDSRRAIARDAIVQTPCYVESFLDKHDTRVEPARTLANHSVLEPIRNDVSRYALSTRQVSSSPLSAPILIITGRQDASVGYRDAWRRLGRYPRASYIALDRAEHGFPIDHHNRVLFESLVADWLGRVEEAEAEAEEGAP